MDQSRIKGELLHRHESSVACHYPDLRSSREGTRRGPTQPQTITKNTGATWFNTNSSQNRRLGHAKRSLKQERSTGPSLNPPIDQSTQTSIQGSASPCLCPKETRAHHNHGCHCLRRRINRVSSFLILGDPHSVRQLKMILPVDTGSDKQKP